MIRIEFMEMQRGPWANEMTANHRIVQVLREHGVPLAARLAFSGVERGILTMTHDADSRNLRFDFVDVDESAADCASLFKKTAWGEGYVVYMNSHQLAAHEDDEL